MTILQLTEYRNDGKFYPLTVVVFNNFAVFEAVLNPVGPLIVGENQNLGTGAFIVGAVPGKNLVVKETVAEITEQLNAGLYRITP